MKVMIEYLTKERRSGRYHYRRRVPKELKDALGKGEIVISLRTTDRDRALREYAKIHADVQRKLDTLSSSAPELAECQETIRLLRGAGVIRRSAETAPPIDRADEKQRMGFLGLALQAEAQMTEEQRKAPLSQAPAHFIRVINAMLDGVNKPEVRLRDALDLYLKEKTDEYNAHRQRLDSERVVKAIEHITAETNPALVDLT